MKLKKPKFWDYKKPNFISNLLYPFSKIFDFLTKLNIKTPKKIPNIKTICVGNIYIGGTGKTSFAIALKKILDEKKIKSCFIKKYYPDQTDEQKILKKFGKTFINKSRFQALKEAALDNYEVAIFDDGLQDKGVFYDLIFVCFNIKNMYGNGRLIPSGPLRENLNNLNNYKNLIFTGNDNDKISFKEIFSKNFKYLNLYDCTYEPLNLNSFDLDENYIVFSGIGNHDTFIEMLSKNKFNIIQNFEYPDHYNYSDRDIDKIINLAKVNNATILTTEKDYNRLNEKYFKEIKYVEVSLKINQLREIKEKLKFFYEDF